MPARPGHITRILPPDIFDDMRCSRQRSKCQAVPGWAKDNLASWHKLQDSQSLPTGTEYWPRPASQEVVLYGVCSQASEPSGSTSSRAVCLSEQARLATGTTQRSGTFGHHPSHGNPEPWTAEWSQRIDLVEPDPRSGSPLCMNKGRSLWALRTLLGDCPWTARSIIGPSC